MPLTDKGKKIKAAMHETYKDPKKAEEVFYRSINAGKVTGAEQKHKPGTSPPARKSSRR